MSGLIEINKIKFDDTKQFNKKLAEKLADSIEIIGLLNPIILTPDFELVAGRLRIEAYKIIGHDSIPAAIVTLDEMQQRIATIDENLMRKRLSRLEQAEQLSERKKIYEAMYPETRRGVAGALAKHKGAKEKLSFAADVASKTGQTPRNVNHIIGIFENLHPDVRELIKGSAIENSFSEMKRLSDYDLDTQLEFAGLIRSGKANNIAAANRLYDEPFKFANTETGKFKKSVKRAEKALRQLIDDGLIESVLGRFNEIDYVFYKEELMEDMKSLHNLQNRVQVAIKIFEDGVRKLEENTFVVQAESQELALAI